MTELNNNTPTPAVTDVPEVETPLVDLRQKMFDRAFEIVNKWRKAGMDFEELRVKAYWLITHQ